MEETETDQREGSQKKDDWERELGKRRILCVLQLQRQSCLLIKIKSQTGSGGTRL